MIQDDGNKPLHKRVDYCGKCWQEGHHVGNLSQVDVQRAKIEHGTAVTIVGKCWFFQINAEGVGQRQVHHSKLSIWSLGADVVKAIRRMIF